MNDSWSLEWSHGHATVHAGAGAIGRTEFLLEDGRRVNPFHEAPWITRGDAVDSSGLKNLRGDWPCLPFGRPYGPSDDLPEPWAGAATVPVQNGVGSLSGSDGLMHGYGASADWVLVSNAEEGLVVSLDYPDDSLIRRVTRSVKPVPGAAAMDVSVEIVARQPCALPFGFHPNFALRGRPGSFRIEPGSYRFGLTHPGREGVTQAMANARFEDLAKIPLAAGGTACFDRLPFAEDREEIVQLCGIDGSMRLVDEDAQVAWTLQWDGRLLPSCLLWMSNRGRHFPPWNGENLCVGVEPVASAFDLGPSVAAARNPISQAGIPTAIQFEAHVPLSLGYRISGRSLSA